MHRRGIVPLAGLMGDATEALGESLGPTMGGLLNASLGNAPEIIIAMFALHRGLIDVVKASLTGSSVGNLLFGLGASMFAGGLVEEVRALGRLERPPGREARQALGYKEVFDHLDGTAPVEETVARVQSRTRRFARRQLTWFRHLGDAGPPAND